MTDAASRRLAVGRERGLRPGARTAGLACALAAAWLVLPPGTAGAAGVGRAGPAAAGAGDTVLAWGANFFGELGDGTTTGRSTPAPVKLPPGFHYSTVRGQPAGYQTGYAVTSSGRLLAWGFNAYGQLGNGSTSNQSTPVFVKLPSGTKVRALAAGQHFSMAMTAGGRILTWGRDNVGQLGIGSHANRDTPVRVHLPTGFTPTAIGAGWNAEAALAIGHESIRD